MKIKYLRIGIFVVLGMVLVALPVQAQEAASSSGFNPQELLRNALQWVDDLGAIAPIAFMLIYIVATVAFLPGSILTLGGGVLFGVVKGSIFVFLGATIGATLAFRTLLPSLLMCLVLSMWDPIMGSSI